MMQPPDRIETDAAWHAIRVEDTLARLGTHARNGLTDAQVRARAAQFGSNVLNPPPPISPLELLKEQFTDFIVLVLVAAAVISGGVALYSGHLDELVNPIAILAIVVLNGFLGFFQEYRAERALIALRQLAAPTARVIRNRAQKIIPAASLVPGDIIELHSGDIVPADARVIHSVHLRADESALTGESLASEKFADLAVNVDAPMDTRANMVFAGTVVVYGRGRAAVTAIGMSTQLGQIARLVSEVKEEETPLQIRLNQVGRFLVYISLAIVAIIFPLGLLRGYSPLDMLLVAVSLAVAAVPEGLAAVVTIALALGLRRMIRRNALIRKLPAVETLGAATVICTDKTGTLTQSEMTAREIALTDRLIHITGEGYARRGEFYADGSGAPAPIVSPEEDYALRLALTIGALCNESRLVEQHRTGHDQVIGDPTEGALLVAAAKAHLTPDELAGEFRFVAEFPFDPLRKRMSAVYARWQEGAAASDETFYAFVKGAPELTLPLCTHAQQDERVLELQDDARAAIAGTNVSLALQARRVLALAYRRLNSFHPNATPQDIEHDLTFVALAAMMDPPRPGAQDAVRAAQHAGINVVMVTGDQPGTAAAVAREVGISRDGLDVITGAELDALDDAALAAQVEHTRVFARVSPEHKLRIVRAFKRDGSIVAMTGDGINDAPALKEAAIGIAMGIKGTDVAKEAADMVLTDDNFASIVAAIEEGRAIYDNIRKFIHYLLSGNIGEVLTVFLGPLLGLPLPLLPIQILWMNLTTDSLPALALGVEKSEPNIMTRPPRRADAPVIGRDLLTLLMGQGLFIGLVQFAGFVIEYFVFTNRDVEMSRAVTLYLCILTQNLHAFNVRSQRLSIFKLGVFSNPYLIASFLAVMLITLITAYVPVFNAILGTDPIGLREWTLIAALAILPVVGMEIVKAIWARRANR